MKTINLKTITIQAAIIFGVLLMSQSPSFAEWGQGDGEKFHKGSMSGEKMRAKMEEVHEKLGLTPEQREKLKAHREGHRAAGKQFREEIKAKKDSLHDAIASAEFDEAKVRQIHSELVALKAKKEEHRLEGILGARQTLSPEQFRKLQEFKKEKRGKWKEKRMKGSRQGTDDDSPPRGRPEPATEE